MLAKVFSCALVGLDGCLIEVEINIASGLPAITIVGLPDTAVQESRERVRAAIGNCGLRFPSQRITINLAPADLPKEGPAYDLPIAVGILAASQQIPSDVLDGAMLIGELSLDGSIRSVCGVVSLVHAAREAGLERVFVPAMNRAEAALIPNIEVYPADHLIAVVEHLLGLDQIPAYSGQPASQNITPTERMTDYSEIKGQQHAKRALEVAAAGNHNVFMVGAPGTGKTLLARATSAILPHLTIDEALEVTRIYSAAGMLPPDKPLLDHRPFRAPHHTISYAGLVGGGQWPRPGEVTLAHRGVLFLDEIAEFSSRSLEVLRQPLEDRQVTLSRAAGSLTFPANFMLIGASNPCPCGYYQDILRPCTCSPSAISRYSKRISGPMLDRIDIHIQVPRVEYDKLTNKELGEPSEVIRERVQRARDIQVERFKALGNTLICNADMGPREVRQLCVLDNDCENLLRSAVRQMQLSARAYHRILKLARTIADLEGAQSIKVYHVAEALQYRATHDAG